MENYYPGDSFVDWLGISVYGAQKKTDACEPFAPRMQAIYQRLRTMAPSKCIFLLEFGATAGHPQSNFDENCKATKWADDTLKAIVANKQWPELRGFSWWNESWVNEDNSVTDMRVQTVPGLKAVFWRHILKPSVIERPIVTNRR
jgi:beta-mannanase